MSSPSKRPFIMPGTDLEVDVDPAGWMALGQRNPKTQPVQWLLGPAVVQEDLCPSCRHATVTENKIHCLFADGVIFFGTAVRCWHCAGEVRITPDGEVK